MIQKVRNIVEVVCNDVRVDFTEATNMEFYVKQGALLLTYPMTAEDGVANKAFVEIPKADAMKLKPCDACVQFAITIDGEPIVSDVIKVCIDELLRGDGYGD